MDLNIKDKVFLISGSSRGIGKGIAKILLQEEGRVVLTGRDQNSISMTYKELQKEFPGKVLSCTGDLNKRDVLKKLEQLVLKKWCRIDGIVANVGGNRPVNEWDIKDNDWEWYFTANFEIAVRFVTKFIPYLKQKKGSIVFISSIAGIEDIGAPIPYSASKAALNMYSKRLARNLAAFHINVNTVAPGNIIFPGGNWEKKINEKPKKVRKIVDGNVPLRQFGSPEDIGNIVAFLLSNKAKFITGSCFIVDGGQTRSF